MINDDDTCSNNRSINSDSGSSIIKQLHQHIENQKKFKSNDNINEFESVLQGNIKSDNSTNAKIIQAISKQEIDGFTLMQHCCIHEGLIEFAQILLDAHVDPNAILKGESNKDNAKHCVLLAAEKGNFEILQAFIDYNKKLPPPPTEKNDVENNYNLNISELRLSDLTAKLSYRSKPCNFESCTEFNETVLHLVLKRPLIEQLLPTSEASITENSADWGNLKKKAQLLNTKYQKCIEVLLKGNQCELDLDNNYDEQIRRVINIKDNIKGRKDITKGNTPLHYALTYNWSEEVVISLLCVGANLATKNNKGERPLKRIKVETLKKFLNEKCIIPTDKERIISGCHINRLLNKECSEPLDGLSIKFKFDFLAPAITVPVSSEMDSEVKNYCSSKEMDVLKSICNSEKHVSLVTHPVLKAYTWIKWKLISKVYNQALRIYILLAICQTWAIYDWFGGRIWTSTRILGGNVLNNRSRLQCYDNLADKFSWNSIYDGNEMMDMYIAFAIHGVFQLLWMTFDLIDFSLILPPSDNRVANSNSSNSGISRFSQKLWALYRYFYDFATIALIIVVLLGSREALWLVIAILTLAQLFQEFFQMTASVKKYFCDINNYYDLFLISMIFVLLFVPNTWLHDTCVISVNDENCNGKESVEKCTIKRCFAAFTIVIMWIRILDKIAKHPKLDKLKLYVSMFYKVQTTFIKFMCFYSMFLLSFSHGFYIMFHQDTEMQKPNMGMMEGEHATSPAPVACAKCENNDKFTDQFSNPWSTLWKTFIMFLGEFEYTDVLEQIRGGNVSKALSCIFLVWFAFMMNMVLLNLLNAMAITDTEKIIKTSKIDCETSTIQTIAYFELIVVNNLRIILKFSRLFSRYVSMESILTSSGTMLFQSVYMDREASMLTLPVSYDNGNNRKGCCNKVIDKLRSWYNDDQCKTLLSEAREILEVNMKRE